MEWCINLHTEFSEHFTLFRSWWHFVSIDDVPSLLEIIILVLNRDLSVFSINTTLNGHDLSVIIDKFVALPSEELEPSCICTLHLENICSTIAWNSHSVILPLPRLNGLSLIIKEELLSFVVCIQCIEFHMSSTMALNNSIHPHL
jgi:hypothetical protein